MAMGRKVRSQTDSIPTSLEQLRSLTLQQSVKARVIGVVQALDEWAREERRRREQRYHNSAVLSSTASETPTDLVLSTFDTCFIVWLHTVRVCGRLEERWCLYGASTETDGE